jgi:hypothetical protein
VVQKQKRAFLSLPPWQAGANLRRRKRVLRAATGDMPEGRRKKEEGGMQNEVAGAPQRRIAIADCRLRVLRAATGDWPCQIHESAA